MVCTDGNALVDIALAFDELLADLGCRQAAIQPGGLEGGVGLEIVLNQIAEILKEMGQVELGRLATTSREVVRTGDAGYELMLALRIVSRVQPSSRSACRWLRPNASTVSAMNRLR